MLKSLSIQNYAIIDELVIEFTTGLSVITGETGAGKSILLGALGLVMGNRADTTVLFDKNSKCIVEAQYDIQKYNLESFFEHADLDFEKLCIIRREISPSGKSRAFINDSPVLLDTIKTLSSQLLDLHQQFDTLELNQEEFQISALDSLGGNKEIVKEYLRLYDEYRTDSRKLEELKQQAKSARQEAEYIKFQLSEFEGLNLKEGELEELETEQRRLSKSEDIIRVGSQISEFLDTSDDSIIERLEKLSREVGPLADLDEKANDINDRFYAVIEELRDISSLSYELSEGEDYNPGRNEEIELRLNTINRLLNKHNVVSDQELVEVEHRLSLQLSQYESVDQDIDILQKKISSLSGQLIKIGKVLYKNRVAGAKQLEKEVNGTLVSLSMKNAELKIDINNTDSIRKNGLDQVSFLFSANRGSTFESISKVASGGELSRLNLAIKSTIAGALTLPTLIFDEIDSGVSGQVSLMMGSILKNLAQNHQTICITHSPQIAAQAEDHFHIYKIDKVDRTVAKVRKLGSHEREIEIAKMLSGDPPSAEAINNAKQLLEITTIK